MKKLLIALALAFTCICVNAAVETGTEKPTKPEQQNQRVTLRRYDTTSKHGNRAPAQPIYGTYDGMMLTLEVSPEEVYTLRIISAADEQEMLCAGEELISGVAVNAATSFDIELTTESGAQYTGHVEISE